MDVAITKMSSKGQIVIPVELRKDLKEGDKLIVFKSDDQIILKPVKDLDKNFEEDIELARRTKKAYKRIAQGKGIKMSWNEFEKELEKW